MPTITNGKSIFVRPTKISFVVQGASKRAAAKLFNIGEDTIYRWMRLNKLGDLSARKHSNFPTKVPIETLRKYVEKHPDHTLKEIGMAVGLHTSKVWKHLKTLKLTRKKRPHSIKNVPKQSVQNLSKTYQQ